MPITITLDPTGPTKRQIVELAFGKITMPGHEFAKTADEIADALTHLNALMLEWPYNLLGYEQSDYALGSVAESSGISREALNGVAAALALRLAAAYGRPLSAEARADMASANGKLHSLVAAVPTMPLARDTPSGSGSRSGRRFLPIA